MIGRLGRVKNEPRTSSIENNGPAPLFSCVKTLGLPLKENEQDGWQPYPLFKATTPCMADFTCHVSVLSAGISPHAPHVHPEEEILIMLKGEANLLIINEDPLQTETKHRLRPGSFVYYPAYQRHTLYNPGPDTTTYLMFKWCSGATTTPSPLGTSIVEYLTNKPLPSNAINNGFMVTEVLNGGTLYLNKLHAHLTSLQPGAGYPPHDDAYDVSIITFDGTVETLGQEVGPYSVIFYAAGEPHGMINVGTSPAVYLVFEFHQANPDPSLTNGAKPLDCLQPLMQMPLRLIRFLKKVSVLGSNNTR